MSEDETKSDPDLPATVTFVPKELWATTEAPPLEGRQAARATVGAEGAGDLGAAPSIPGYTIVRRLGSGSFGEVWEATDDKLAGQRRVAIKCFTRHRGRNHPLLRGEVERLLKLSTDSRIVRLYDVGWDHDPPYFVMEHLAGGSLAERLRGPAGEARTLPVEEAARIVRDVAKALAYLHANAVIHCDVKPANVLLNEHGQVRLADFGQSRLRDQTGPTYGTLFYMPPEQVDPETVTDVRVDIYALGAVLYEMLTGHPPYATSVAASRVRSSGSPRQRMAQYAALVRKEAPASEHRTVPGVDAALAEIVERCLEVDSERRYQNIQQVRTALDRRQRLIAQRPLLRLGIVVPLLLLLAMGVGGAWLGKISNDGATRALVETTLAKQLEGIAFISRTIEEDLRAAQRRVEREAEDAGLRRIVDALARPGQALPRPVLPHPEGDFHDLDRDPVRVALRRLLAARLDALYADYDGRGYYSWVLADANGWIWARGAPTGGGDVVGRWFGYREWWSGLAQPAEGASTREYRPARRHIGLTAPFRSQAQGNPMLVSVGAPIWPSGVDVPSSADQPLAVLSASISLDNLDLLFGAARHGVQPQGCPSSFITLFDRAALVRHPCADRATLPLEQYGHRTGIVAIAERFRRQEPGSCVCVSADERAFGKPACCHIVTDSVVRAPGRAAERYLAVATVVDPRIDAPGRALPAARTEAEGWVVAVQENLDSSIAPIRRLGRRFTWLVLAAVAAGLVLVGVLWGVLLRTNDVMPRSPRRKRGRDSL